MSPADPKLKARFKDVTDRMTADIPELPTIPLLAAKLGKSANHVFRWRRAEDPRVPAPGWEGACAEICEDAAAAFRRRADQLEEMAKELGDRPRD